MAGHAPTHDEIWTQAGYVVKLRNTLDLAMTNLIAAEVAINLNVGEGNQLVALPHSQARSLVATAAAPLQGGDVQAALTPFLREFVDMISAADGQNPTALAANEMLAILREYMVDNDKHIPSRNLTISAPAAVGAPAGDGTLRKCSVDKFGKTIEAVGAEMLTFRCARDKNSGAKEHAEAFDVFGEPRYPTEGAAWTGSGLVAALVSANAASTNTLRNASFEKHSGSDDTAFASTTALTDWVASAAASFQHRSFTGSPTYVYRGYPGEPATLWSVEQIASGTLTQDIFDVNRSAQFVRDAPYFCRVAIMRKNAATGNPVLTLGGSSATVDLSTLTDDEWNHLYIALDEDAWFDNFTQASLNLVLSCPDLAVGEIVWDDIVLTPMTRIGGHYYVLDGGATPWQIEDAWEADVSEGTRGIFGYWFWRAFGANGWLPAVAAATEITAAGGRTLTFADAGPDTITASSGDFVADGYQVGMLLTVADSASNDGVYTIAGVTATVLTLSAGDALVAEGPVAATTTLNATASNPDPA